MKGGSCVLKEWGFALLIFISYPMEMKQFGLTEPSSSTEICAGSNGDLCAVYVNSEGCGCSLHQQPYHICATISALYQCASCA